MAAFDIANFPDQSVLRLVGTLDNSTASPTVTVTWDASANGPYKQVDNTPGNDTLITEIFLTASANLAETGGSEGFWLTGGAVVSGETRQVSYTATYRGLLNSEAANPPTAGYSRNYKTHKNNALCIPSEVIAVKDLDDTFTAGTTTNTAEAGEDIEALDSVSLHTDGKLYEYHSTNYPNLVGAVSSAFATAATATYTTFGGVSTGHSSLTVGATQYAEDTGTITETSSTTTTILGTAESATEIRVAKAGESPADFPSNTFNVYDNSDVTKKVDLDVSGVTTATTRTLTVPDKDGTVATIADTFNLYGDGSDGALDTTGGSVAVALGSDKHYSSITIDTNDLTFTGSDDCVIIRCSGNCVIQNGGKMDLSGLGAAGGATVTTILGGQSLNGLIGVTASTSWQSDGLSHYGDGGNYHDDTGATGGSGGSGATAASGSSSAGSASGSSAGTAVDTGYVGLTMVPNPAPGSGGGSGGATSSHPVTTGGAGGAGGGGVILLVKGDLTLSSSPSIDATGADGSDGTEEGAGAQITAGGGGGGGAGGHVICFYGGTLTGSASNIDSSGGAGGSGVSRNSNHSDGTAGTAGIKILLEDKYLA